VGTLNFLNDGTGSAALTLDASASFHGLVGGFGTGDQIDLQDIAFVASTKKGGTKASFTEAANFDSGTLTVTDGTQTANIQLFGEYIASEFVAASDGHGGTLITFTSASTTEGHGHATASPVSS
jgi:hypothetical protein